MNPNSDVSEFLATLELAILEFLMFQIMIYKYSQVVRISNIMAYVTETNMPTKLGIYAIYTKYQTCIYEDVTRYLCFI